MRLLAGDIGGTNARLAYFEVAEPSGEIGAMGRLRLIARGELLSRAHPGLQSVVEAFRREHPQPIDAAAFGVAGPVREGRSETPNLAWAVDAAELAAALGLPRVELLNDVAATAYGLAYLEDADLEVLHAGRPEARGHRAVISAGTGLGQAGLFWDGVRHRPFASEGGHCDFAPHDALGVELWSWHSRRGHVSYERVLSGPGLVALFTFLRETGRGVPSAQVERALAEEDPAAVIARHGLARTDGLCALALDRFAALYGAAAGNVALQFFATGGVYVGGGIAPKIRARLREGAFMDTFLAKGRMRAVLEQIPVKLLVNDKAALWGAAHVAAFGP